MFISCSVYSKENFVKYDLNPGFLILNTTLNILILTSLFILLISIIATCLSFLSKENFLLFHSIIPFNVSFQYSSDSINNLKLIIGLLICAIICKFFLTTWENNLYNEQEKKFFKSISHKFYNEFNTNFLYFNKLAHEYFHNYIVDITFGVKNFYDQFFYNIAILTSIYLSMIYFYFENKNKKITKDTVEENIKTNLKFLIPIFTIPIIFFALYGREYLSFIKAAKKNINNQINEHLKHNNHLHFDINKITKKSMDLIEGFISKLSLYKNLSILFFILAIYYLSADQITLEDNTIKINIDNIIYCFIFFLPLFLGSLLNNELFNIKNNLMKKMKTITKIAILENLKEIKTKSEDLTPLKFLELQTKNLILKKRHKSGVLIPISQPIDLKIKHNSKILFFSEKQERNLIILTKTLINQFSDVDNDNIFIKTEDNKLIDINLLSKSNWLNFIFISYKLKFQNSLSIFENFKKFNPQISILEVKTALMNSLVNLNPEDFYENNFPRHLKLKILIALSLVVSKNKNIIILDSELFKTYNSTDLEGVLNLLVKIPTTIIVLLEKKEISESWFSLFNSIFKITKNSCEEIKNF